MTQTAMQLCWLFDSRSNLERLREESWLTETEIAIVDRGITAIDSLLFEFGVNNGNMPWNSAGNLKFT